VIAVLYGGVTLTRLFYPFFTSPVALEEFFFFAAILSERVGFVESIVW